MCKTFCRLLGPFVSLSFSHLVDGISPPSPLSVSFCLLDMEFMWIYIPPMYDEEEDLFGFSFLFLALLGNVFRFLHSNSENLWHTCT